MKRIEFFSLTRPVQERFIEATRGQGAPPPLLVAKLPLPFGAIGWGLLSALAVVGWIYAVKQGYGQLANPLALQPGWMLGVEAGLLVLAVLLALQSRRVFRKQLRLPFVPTVYLFPIGVVDARSQNVALHGWEELTDLSVGGSSARLAFAHGSFSFPLTSAAQGEELKARSAEYREMLAGGGPPEKDLVALDPLRDNGFRNPFSPVDSMRPPSPLKLPLLELGLVLGAVAIAWGVFFLRNRWGEHVIYERAVTANSIESYRAYLTRGGKQSDVSDLHLPRAELRAAIAENNVPAIERYQAAHPSSKIETEVQAALRAALLKALEDAKAKGTITALREFEATNKAHLKLVPELPGARVAYLASVLEKFQKTAKPTKEQWMLARRLIVYADQHGGKVSVRFTQQESRSLEKNQKMLSASAYYGGDKTLPSHFLTGDPTRKAEDKAGTDLAAALGRAFPSDLVHFELGPPVPPGTAPGSFKEPTIYVNYRLEISSPLVSKKPRGIYSALGLFALGTLSIPDKEPTTELKHTAWHAPDVRKVEAGELPPENVYNEMLGRAWTRFTNRYAAPWLGQ